MHDATRRYYLYPYLSRFWRLFHDGLPPTCSPVSALFAFCCTGQWWPGLITASRARRCRAGPGSQQQFSSSPTTHWTELMECRQGGLRAPLHSGNCWIMVIFLHPFIVLLLCFPVKVSTLGPSFSLPAHSLLHSGILCLDS